MALEGRERGQTIVPQVEIAEKTQAVEKIHWKLEN